MTASPSPPRNKGGAPPGNQNARKHGFYSHAITRSERGDLKTAVSGRLHPEIKLFKVLIARAAARLKPLGQGSDLSLQESLAMLSTVSYAIARLVSFYRTNDKLSAPDRELSDDFRLRMGMPSQEEEQEMYTSGRQSVGGQPGNTNALRHGFYASVFKPSELRRLDQGGERELEDELVFLRTLLKRTVVLLYAQEDLDTLEHMRALRVIFYAGACVEKLECTLELLSPESTWWDIFMDAVREANKRDGIV